MDAKATTAEGGVRCPKGSYCPEGTAQSMACPAGKLGIAPGLQSLEECSNCTAGKKIYVFVSADIPRLKLIRLMLDCCDYECPI